MHIVGLMLVRNEADIVRVNLLHHLAQGVDRFLVVDNGSTDGTDRVLRELAGDGRVRWTRDEGPYRQGEIMTELAREAFRGRADWVLPIDADEFWYAPRGGLRHVLAASAAGALGARVVNFVQRRGQLERSPGALLQMTRRHVPIAVEDVEELVEGRHIAFVEMAWGVKWISRPTASIEIASGNQRVRGVAGRPPGRARRSSASMPHCGLARSWRRGWWTSVSVPRSSRDRGTPRRVRRRGGGWPWTWSGRSQGTL